MRKDVAAIRRKLTKFAFDWMVSLLMIVVLSPIFILLIIFIPLTSHGPALYKQERLGRNAKPFNIYKFRSMKLDAEKQTGPVFAIKNDQRITPLGNFLRHTHIDELPQLFNVIKGDMSLVGPRPERQYFVEQYSAEIACYNQRMSVKPGMTGLAQIEENYDATADNKLVYDLLYIKNQSLSYDITILYRTFIHVIKKKLSFKNEHTSVNIIHHSMDTEPIQSLDKNAI